VFFNSCITTATLIMLWKPRAFKIDAAITERVSTNWNAKSPGTQKYDRLESLRLYSILTCSFKFARFSNVKTNVIIADFSSKIHETDCNVSRFLLSAFARKQNYHPNNQ
jgi:hypothetical protein